MSVQERNAGPRRWVTIALVAALAVLALVFHAQLIAWFSGESMAASSGSSVTFHASVAAPSASGMPGEVDHYTCSMHPSVKQATPGKCPICGMDLIPVTREQQVEGVVMIDDARRQLIGVRTEPVVIAPMRKEFRAVGYVTYDESSLADVNLKVHGWITKLYVDRTGQKVTRGQPLLSLYSPELYNAEQDFLLAMQSAAVPSLSPGSGPNRQETMARAARQRLHLLGLEDAQIDALIKQGAPSESVPIAAPASGFIIEKDVVQGASVDAGMRLFRIAALTKVWIEAQVYEADLASVHTGQAASVTLDYVPGRTYDAKVAYVYPYLDPQTRTAQVRLELSNAELDLRPGMYASVTLRADLGPRVQVPSAAVVYTGPRRLVFVDLGQGRFRPEEVTVGAASNGMYEVLSGLKPGDQVATSGVFLIAAEARISTASKYWDSPQSPTDGGASAMPTAEATSMPEPLSPTSAPPLGRATEATAMHPAPSSAPAWSGAPSSPALAPSPRVGPSAPPATVYSCPMHPEVTSATPGKCPKCGMDLQPTPQRGAP
jgi:Cu(I)/Ag(I) efflux system membrane fusion protein